MRLTLKEIFTTDVKWLRFGHMGLAPLFASMGILWLASFAAIYAKKVYVREMRINEKQEIFKSIDWT